MLSRSVFQLCLFCNNWIACSNRVNTVITFPKPGIIHCFTQMTRTSSVCVCTRCMCVSLCCCVCVVMYSSKMDVKKLGWVKPNVQMEPNSDAVCPVNFWFVVGRPFSDVSFDVIISSTTWLLDRAQSPPDVCEIFWHFTMANTLGKAVDDWTLFLRLNKRFEPQNLFPFGAAKLEFSISIVAIFHTPGKCKYRWVPVNPKYGWSRFLLDLLSLKC